MQFSRAARQNLTLEALISWRDEYGIAHAVVGATRDVNDQGIYLYISGEGPALAAQVEITALLPAFLQRNGRTYLRGFGTVVRVEAEGFALGGKFRIETEYEPARIATPALQVSAA